MPIYEYRCQSCGHRYEKLQKFSDPPCKKCPRCGGPLKKLISSPAIQFKGNGFYINDYGKKGSSGEGKKTKSETAAKPEGAGEKKEAAAPAESKTEKKATPKSDD